jgi:hypothetical protein
LAVAFYDDIDRLSNQNGHSKDLIVAQPVKSQASIDPIKGEKKGGVRRDRTFSK